jgi:methyltransferase (TIGR00027 family)
MAVTYVPLDFEKESLTRALTASGFDATRPAIFLWLGVVPYLTRAAVFATLTCIADIPGGEVVFDYPNPPDSLAGGHRDAHLVRAARVAALGEPWITYFDSEQLADRLAELGFETIADLGPAEIAAHYFGCAPDTSHRDGGHVIRAARTTLISCGLR